MHGMENVKKRSKYLLRVLFYYRVYDLFLKMQNSFCRCKLRPIYWLGTPQSHCSFRWYGTGEVSGRINTARANQWGPGLTITRAISSNVITTCGQYFMPCGKTRKADLYLHSGKHINRLQRIYGHANLKWPTELAREMMFFPHATSSIAPFVQHSILFAPFHPFLPHCILSYVTAIEVTPLSYRWHCSAHIAATWLRTLKLHATTETASELRTHRAYHKPCYLMHN